MNTEQIQTIRIMLDGLMTIRVAARMTQTTKEGAGWVHIVRHIDEVLDKAEKAFPHYQDIYDRR